MRRTLREIIFAWSIEYPKDEITLLLRQRDGKPADIPAGAHIAFSRLYPHAVFATVGSLLATRKVRADAVLTHTYGNPFVPTAVFIHDFLFLSNPEWFTLSERLYFKPIPWLARRSLLAYSSTESESKRIASYGISAVPVGLGVSIDGPVVPSEMQDPSLHDLSPGQFLLTVGRLNIRKNVDRIIEAFLLTGRASPKMPLVIVGQTSGESVELSGYRKEIENGIIRPILYLDDSSLAWMYKNAGVFVCLSLGEGFGLPPVEAASVGCPVVVSDIDVFHETLDGYAIFCDPFSVKETSDAIELALSRPRESWDSSNVKRYTWTGMIKRMREELAKCVEDQK